MLSGIDELVASAMSTWKIPGLAIAVVRGTETLLLHGYGRRDSGTADPVTPNTKFLVCSLTKSITAAGVGLLVEEGKLDWTTPVRDVLPEFRLQDAVATEHVTFLDLLCHRSGLPAHDRIWSAGDLSRAEMLAAMRHLQPSCGLRQRFQYSNLGYVVAGMGCERLTQMSWEQFISERLLSRLGFSDVGFSVESLLDSADHAHPHLHREERLIRGKAWPMAATPAGGLVTSVSDFSKWVKALCSAGIVEGRRVLSVDTIKEMMRPHQLIGEHEFPEIGSISYGLGLRHQSYRGSRLIAHSGGQPGWGTYMGVLPEEGIGVAVFTNSDPTPVTELLAYSLFDRLTNRPALDWFGRFQETTARDLDQERANNGARENRRGRMPLPRSLDDYVGDYHHPAYGCMRIVRCGETLGWYWRGQEATLMHCNNDAFDIVGQPTMTRYEDLKITFLCDGNGIIDRLICPLESMVDEIVFRKRSEAPRPS